MSIADNLQIVNKRIRDAATRAGVLPENIKLIAVTKTVQLDKIIEAIECGVTDIGENYVQEAVEKHAVIGNKVKWHMIGHLQTNKVKQSVGTFDMIQSVDSFKLGKEIGKRAIEIGKVMDVLVEVNVSGEASKTGVPQSSALELCSSLSDIDGIRLCGLMGIAPLTADIDEIRRSFANLRRMWEMLPPEHAVWLSMGMTSDFEIAIEEGSNMVRIGTAIFGPRY